MLTVWGRASSVNVQKVMWVIGELGLAHERFDVGGQFGGLDAPDYLAMNPHGLIPTVRTEDGVILWESNAVVRYLARHDPERRLWPASGQLQADADQWAEWAAVAVQRPMQVLFVSYVRTPPAERNTALMEAEHRALTRAMRVAHEQLARQPFLAGDHLTIADIAFGTFLYRYHELEIARADLPALSSYYERLRSRSAYPEHVMVDFNFMRAA